jgi:uncharacterized surface protein with fasciclin (FAS1) repeats
MILIIDLFTKPPLFCTQIKTTIMKRTVKTIVAICLASLVACTPASPEAQQAAANTEAEPQAAGQSGVVDEVSNPNVVQIAVGSKDHSTLVTAVKAAELVDALSNAGPFTVFAPTNEAFAKLPAGTIEDLLKPEKKDALIDILQYHVFVGVLKQESLQDGQAYGQVNGGNIKITLKDGKPIINGKAHILASIPASNGIIHVIDEVLLPGQ